MLHPQHQRWAEPGVWSATGRLASPPSGQATLAACSMPRPALRRLGRLECRWESSPGWEKLLSFQPAACAAAATSVAALSLASPARLPCTMQMPGPRCSVTTLQRWTPPGRWANLPVPHASDEALVPGVEGQGQALVASQFCGAVVQGDLHRALPDGQGLRPR